MCLEIKYFHNTNCWLIFVKVGPAGAQFGLLACLMIEVLDVWPMLRRPEQALLKLLAVVALLLLLGLLPWVDNWAHIFGFVFGLLLSSALLPFVTIGSAAYSRHRKRVQVWLCLGGAVLLFLALVTIFYLVPVIDCPLCDLFNCLPITSQFCAEQDINFGRDEIVWRRPPSVLHHHQHHRRPWRT